MDSTTTARRFYRSAAAATFSQLWRVGVAFGTRLVLRRLIDPADWGIWDWAIPIFLILGAVRDLGLVYHVVRVKPRPYGNLLALELGWGTLLVAATVGGAPLLAHGFSEASPDVVWVIRALALFLFFEGVASVPKVYLECELAVGRAVAPEILRNFLFAATSITLAWLRFGVWSLVIAQVLSVAVYATHLWIRVRGEIPLRWERGQMGLLIRRSLPLAVIWALVVLTRHVDPFILAARFEASVVGNYMFAYETAFLVVTILQPAVARALYPALAALSDEPHKMFEAYRLATLLISSVEVPTALVLFTAPDVVLRILGGNQWVLAPMLLRILALTPLVDPFSRLGGELLKNRNGDGWWIASTSFTLVSFVGFGLLLTGRMGPRGMAWTNFLQLGVLIMVWSLWRIDAGALYRLCGDLAWIYLPPIPLFLLVWWLTPGPGTLRFVASAAAAAVSLGFYLWRFGGAFRAFVRDPARV